MEFCTVLFPHLLPGPASNLDKTVSPCCSMFLGMVSALVCTYMHMLRPLQGFQCPPLKMKQTSPPPPPPLARHACNGRWGGWGQMGPVYLGNTKQQYLAGQLHGKVGQERARFLQVIHCRESRVTSQSFLHDALAFSTVLASGRPAAEPIAVDNHTAWYPTMLPSSSGGYYAVVTQPDRTARATSWVGRSLERRFRLQYPPDTLGTISPDRIAAGAPGEDELVGEHVGVRVDHGRHVLPSPQGLPTVCLVVGASYFARPGNARLVAALGD